jgi:metal-responsive CopG/Arc/MetJ family transcriptional regulator
LKDFSLNIRYRMAMSKVRVVSLCLDESLVALLDKVKETRRDYSRSNTIRTLILERLAEMSYLTDEEKKALGVKFNGDPRK